jgi:hypothetical protein
MPILKEETPTQISKDSAGFSLSYVIDNGIGKKIPTVRCSTCFQHLSLHWNEVIDGRVIGDLICPNCKTNNTDYTLNTKFSKMENKTYID